MVENPFHGVQNTEELENAMNQQIEEEGKDSIIVESIFVDKKAQNEQKRNAAVSYLPYSYFKHILFIKKLFGRAE